MSIPSCAMLLRANPELCAQLALWQKITRKKTPSTRTVVSGEDLETVGFAAIATGWAEILRSPVGRSLYISASTRSILGGGFGPGVLSQESLMHLALSMNSEGVDDIQAAILDMGEWEPQPAVRHARIIDRARARWERMQAEVDKSERTAFSVKTGGGNKFLNQALVDMPAALANLRVGTEEWNAEQAELKAKRDAENKLEAAREKKRLQAVELARELEELTALNELRAEADLADANPNFGAW